LPTLVFAHANSYPAGTYEQLFERWRAAGWQVAAPQRFGHDPRFPVNSNWSHLRDELGDFVAGLGSDPVWLVGHSLGGYLSLMLACRQPQRVQGVVMLDSPIVAGWRAHSVQVAKATGLIKRVSPGRIARRRRPVWPNAAAAAEHFATKPLFARWDPAVLADYMATGLEPDPTATGTGGVRLAFDRQIEARIYDTLPHHLPQLLRRHPPRCPVGFIGGTASREIRQVGLAATRALVGERQRWMDGTHLFPMERPAETAMRVLELLETMR
jgi:pimeloyl-ACP methyl ester carboxylesterase